MKIDVSRRFGFLVTELGRLYSQQFDRRARDELRLSQAQVLLLAVLAAHGDEPVSTTMQALDTTIANVALPHMQGSLQASQDQITWVLTSYIVASAIALPLTGWLCSLWGQRKVFLISVIGFTIASGMCRPLGVCSVQVEAIAALPQPDSCRLPTGIAGQADRAAQARGTQAGMPAAQVPIVGGQLQVQGGAGHDATAPQVAAVAEVDRGRGRLSAGLWCAGPKGDVCKRGPCGQRAELLLHAGARASDHDSASNRSQSSGGWPVVDDLPDAAP